MTAFGIMAIIILAGAAALLVTSIVLFARRNRMHGITEGWRQHPVKTFLVCLVIAALLIALCVAELIIEG